MYHSWRWLTSCSLSASERTKSTIPSTSFSCANKCIMITKTLPFMISSSFNISFTAQTLISNRLIHHDTSQINIINTQACFQFFIMIFPSLGIAVSTYVYGYTRYISNISIIIVVVYLVKSCLSIKNWSTRCHCNLSICHYTAFVFRFFISWRTGGVIQFNVCYLRMVS